MISGFLLVNKDAGITSSRVVQILKKKFNLKKVGHLGTLDPMATGLLIIAINRATMTKFGIKVAELTVMFIKD